LAQDVSQYERTEFDRSDPIQTCPKMTICEKLVLSHTFPFHFALIVAEYLLARYSESRFIVRRNDKQPGGNKPSAAAPGYILQIKGIPMENIKRIKQQLLKCGFGWNEWLSASFDGETK
jgi:hypothetical protein